MSEVIRLGGSCWLAVLISVAVQLSYHLYQGPAGAITITITFTVFSIYYVRTRRVMPLILAHLGYDLHALFAGQVLSFKSIRVKNTKAALLGGFSYNRA